MVMTIFTCTCAAVDRRTHTGLLCVYDYQQDLQTERRLGEGHFGTVVLATLRRKGGQGARRVAVKRLRNDLRHAAHHVELLLEEAVTMSQIPPHRNVVSVHGICSDPPAIVMEYIEDALEADEYLLSVEWALPGLQPYIQDYKLAEAEFKFAKAERRVHQLEEDRRCCGLLPPLRHGENTPKASDEQALLRQVEAKRRKVCYRQEHMATALHVLSGAAAGVAHMHSQRPSLLHRDLRAPNIMVRAKDAQAFVGDFGLSREQTQLEELYNDTGRELPRARYPPEYHSMLEYTTMADVYMFGLLCHELLGLEEPFVDLDDRDYELMMRGHLEPAPLPDSLPAGVIGITTACLDPNPSARPDMAMVQSVLETSYAGLYKGLQEKKSHKPPPGKTGEPAKSKTKGPNRSPMFRATFASPCKAASKPLKPRASG